MILVRELEPWEDFYELMENDEIIIYELETRAYNKMARNMSENTVKVCVKDYPLLRRRLMFDLNIVNLPVAFYFGHMILMTDNFLACKDRIDEIKFDLLEQKVKRIINKTKIHVFIEDTPENPNSERTKSLMKIFCKLNMSGITFGYYNVLLNRRLRNYVCDMVRCEKIPLVFVFGKYIGNLEAFEEMVVQKKFDLILKQLRKL